MSEPIPEHQTPLLISIQDFLFGAPLYAEYDFDSVKPKSGSMAYEMFNQPLVVAGYSPHCHRTATFRRTAGQIDIAELQHKVNNIPALGFEITCARNAKHTIL